MLNLLLATVETAAPAAEAGPIESLKQTFMHFGVEPKALVMQVISFLILYGVLYKFAIKPTTSTMELRNQKISDGLKHAEETQTRLAAAAQESAQIVRNASVDAQKIVDEARKIAKEFAEKQQAEAIARSAETLAKAQQSIELEHRKMLDQARGEIARLVVSTTERVLAKKLSDADRASYNEAATKELTSL